MDHDLRETLTNWRRHLHANPGVTLQEGPTADFVAARLRELGIEVTEGVGGHGVIGTLRRPGATGTGNASGGNRSVGLRADMDALPIAENNTSLPWRSTVPGVMHACGHDGHTAALLGAAALLTRDAGWSGTVQLVFQPAEEGGGGARSMLADGLLSRFPMERIFGWHNWPALPAGAVAVHDGPVMAAGRRFEISFDGVAGHAALPHLTRDPMLAAGHCIVALQSVVARNLDPMRTGVLSVTMCEAGDAFNQIPARVTLRGTMRFFLPEDGALMVEAMQRVADGIAATFGLRAGFRVLSEVSATINHRAEAELAAASAGAVARVRRDVPSAMTSEDFGAFLEQIPGAFVWIGGGEVGEDQGLHNPGYDFNDAILPVAASFLADVAKRSLGG